jgi:hypothetical protein
MRFTRLLALAAAIGMTVVVACSQNDGVGPQIADPGFVSVRLTSPNGDDGALRFIIAGGPVDSLRASGATLYSASTGQNARRVIVAGNIQPSSVALFWLSDRHVLDNYTVTLEEVAASGTFAQRSLQDYSLTLDER